MEYNVLFVSECDNVAWRNWRGKVEYSKFFESRVRWTTTF